MDVTLHWVRVLNSALAAMRCMHVHILTFPLQLVAVGDELQRVCLVRRINVINVDVQVIWCIEKVIWQQRALALVQWKVHLRGNQCTAFAVGRGPTVASSSSGWAHIQGARGSCSRRGEERRGEERRGEEMWCQERRGEERRGDETVTEILKELIRPISDDPVVSDTYRLCRLWDHKRDPCLRTLVVVCRETGTNKQPWLCLLKTIHGSIWNIRYTNTTQSQSSPTCFGLCDFVHTAKCNIVNRIRHGCCHWSDYKH